MATPVNKSFVDVKKGEIPRADNVNNLHAAVRELQYGQPRFNEVDVEIVRIDIPGLPTSKPSADDLAIGTAIADVGTATIHGIETSDYDEHKINQVAASMKRKFINAGQRIFSRDDVFGLATVSGWHIPFMLGGSLFVLCRTTSVIPRATAWDMPGFGNASVIDWKSSGDELETTGQTIRVANVAYGSSDSIQVGTTIGVMQYGKIYIAIFVLCDGGTGGTSYDSIAEKFDSSGSTFDEA